MHIKKKACPFHRTCPNPTRFISLCIGRTPPSEHPTRQRLDWSVAVKPARAPTQREPFIDVKQRFRTVESLFTDVKRRRMNEKQGSPHHFISTAATRNKANETRVNYEQLVTKEHKGYFFTFLLTGTSVISP